MSYHFQKGDIIRNKDPYLGESAYVVMGLDSNCYKMVSLFGKHTKDVCFMYNRHSLDYSNADAYERINLFEADIEDANCLESGCIIVLNDRIYMVCNVINEHGVGAFRIDDNSMSFEIISTNSIRGEIIQKWATDHVPRAKSDH